MPNARPPPPAGPPALPDDTDPGLRFLAPRERPLAAADHAAPLLANRPSPPRLDTTLAVAFLAEGGYDARRSFFEGLALAPARCPLTRSDTGVLTVGRGRAPPRRKADAPEPTRVRALIDAAVERTLAPHARAGVWLSGGLDSSAVAAAASRAWQRLGRDPGDLHLYHHLPRRGPDEAWAARAVATHLGHELVALRADDRDPFQGTDAIFATLDFPPDGGGPRTSVRLALRMREDGVGVFLTGDGGDELFAAPPPATLRATVVARLPARFRRTVRRTFRRSPPPPAWLVERRAGRPTLCDRPHPRRGLGRQAAVRDASIRNARQAAIVSWLRALGQTVGIEAACPLLDATVADEVVRVPQALHRTPPDKALLRRAYADALPGAVLRRDADQPAWEPLHREDVAVHGATWRDWLETGRLASAGFVPRGAAAEALRAATAGRTEDLNLALALVGLERWCAARDIEIR